MKLSKAQIRQLKGQGHHLKPVVMIGQAGISDNIINELGIALDHHELVKIRIFGADREEKPAILETLCQRSQALLIQSLGHTALLFRRNTKKPKIALVNK